MNAMIPMYVYTTNFIADRAEAVKDHYKNRDRGASMVEYAGLVVLAAVILAALYAGFKNSNFGHNITKTIGKIFNGNGNGCGFNCKTN